MKKNKFIIIYSIFASAIILFALGFLGFNLYSEYNHGYERTKRRFDHFTNSVKKLSEKEFTSKRDFNLEFEKIVGDISDFSFLEVKENDKVIYIYPDSEAESNSESSLIKHYIGNFVAGEIKYSVTGDLYVLRPGSIYYYSKIAFLIVLIITIITIALVIYFNINDPDKKTTIIEENEIIPENETTTEKNIFEEALENKTTESNEQSIEDESGTEISVSEEQKEEKVELPYKEFEPSEIPTLKEDEVTPSGLFSPTTGLGWESYLITRLDNELNRAISSEFDLSLFIFQIPGLVRESEKIKEVCEYLITQFQFKDLLFEYKEDCIVAIKVNMNIDEALILADKLYVDIMNIIGSSNKVYIGITTRTIRMISSDRLLKEANEALIHAQEDSENPIIAFRANAEKYREFLEKNN